jgi:hypothetical protein
VLKTLYGTHTRDRIQQIKGELLSLTKDASSCIGKASFFFCVEIERDSCIELYMALSKNNQDRVQNPARLLCLAETEMVTIATTNYL